MMVEGDTRQLLDALKAQEAPPLYDGTPDEGRAAYREMAKGLDLPAEPVAEVADLFVDGADGPIAVRVYHPHPAAEGPVVVFFHGGGWVIGDLDTHHGFCAFLANRLDLRVLSVDYRLAPEHRFPAAYEDCVRVAQWADSSPGELGRPVAGIATAGDSAGGSLAVAVSLHLNGDGTRRVLAQMLLYPATDLVAESVSYARFAEGYLLDRRLMQWFRDHYIGSEAERADPRTSVLRADDLSASPPTVLLTCGLDVLRDEGRAFGARLVSAGVALSFREAAGQIHGIVNMRGALPSAVPVLSAVIDDFGRLLRSDH
ncbi:alpha/beta hydrolase [Sphingomonas sp. S6]|jgi:acetyl esterase|uniref:alpha/beta hydrolase n=1 Tax=Sphingomonas sp. S6 TaxID=3368600 RepID=UPI0028ED330E|nr:alpha/beta hydrolase [uncultured Sphingomonas sp.]